MLNNLAVCALLATISYLVIPSNGARQLSNSFTKCNSGDNNCIKQSFTNFVQHPEQNPNLGVPNTKPYVLPHPVTISSFQLTESLSANAYWTDITVTGLDKGVCQEFSGYQPGQAASDVKITAYIPYVKIEMNSRAELKLAVTTLKSQGRIIVQLENVVVPMTGQAIIVQRDGNDYVTVGNPSVTTQVSSFNGQIAYDNAIIAPIFNQVVGLINSNWPTFKTVMDPTINTVIVESLLEIVTPMFNDIPLQSFFNNYVNV